MGVDAEQRLQFRRLDEIDANRRGYIRRNFRQDVADPSLYDLVVKTLADAKAAGM